MQAVRGISLASELGAGGRWTACLDDILWEMEHLPKDPDLDFEDLPQLVEHALALWQSEAPIADPPQPSDATDPERAMETAEARSRVAETPQTRAIDTVCRAVGRFEPHDVVIVLINAEGDGIGLLAEVLERFAWIRESAGYEIGPDPDF